MKHISAKTITLSTTQLDTSSPSYQTPLPVDEVKPLIEYEGQHSQIVPGIHDDYQNRYSLGMHDDNLPPRSPRCGWGRSNGNIFGRHRGRGQGSINHRGQRVRWVMVEVVAER